MSCSTLLWSASEKRYRASSSRPPSDQSVATSSPSSPSGTAMPPSEERGSDVDQETGVGTRRSGDSRAFDHQGYRMTSWYWVCP
jgi:hypothetical protein